MPSCLCSTDLSPGPCPSGAESWCLMVSVPTTASEPPPGTIHPKGGQNSGSANIQTLSLKGRGPTEVMSLVRLQPSPLEEMSEKLSSDNSQCLLEELPAIWRVVSFAKLLSQSCPVILLNTNVPVICHWVLPFCCSRGSPNC